MRRSAFFRQTFVNTPRHLVPALLGADGVLSAILSWVGVLSTLLGVTLGYANDSLAAKLLGAAALLFVLLLAFLESAWETHVLSEAEVRIDVKSPFVFEGVAIHFERMEITNRSKTERAALEFKCRLEAEGYGTIELRPDGQHYLRTRCSVIEVNPLTINPDTSGDYALEFVLPRAVSKDRIFAKKVRVKLIVGDRLKPHHPTVIVEPPRLFVLPPDRRLWKPRTT